MHWPEQLIVGGATRNSTSALRSARALQTVVQLMGEREMFEYYADSFKVHHVSWSQEKATAVLDAWQRKFAAVSIFLNYFNIYHPSSETYLSKILNVADSAEYSFRSL